MSTTTTATMKHGLERSARAGAAATNADVQFTEAGWTKLDQLKPDTNKPVMRSQTQWLSGEATKLGKTVDSLTRQDIFIMASRTGYPGPSEIARIRDKAVADAASPASRDRSPSFSSIDWEKFNRGRQDSNKPVMRSQTQWLESEASKLGKSVAQLTTLDVMQIARQAGSPGPSEIERIQTFSIARAQD